MCVRVRVCMHVCVHVCAYVCTCGVCMCAMCSVCVCNCMCMCDYVCACVCMCVCVCVHVCVIGASLRSPTVVITMVILCKHSCVSAGHHAHAQVGQVFGRS